MSLVAERYKQMISNKLDIRRHQIMPMGEYFQTSQGGDGHGQHKQTERTGEELNLDVNGFSYNLLRMRPPQHVIEEQARRVGIHSLILRNKLAAECQARHQATFLYARR